MEFMLSSFAADHPWAFSIFSIIGIFRVVFKPLMGVIKTAIDASGSQKAEDAYAHLMESQAYRALAWGVDYLASIKLPGQK